MKRRDFVSLVGLGALFPNLLWSRSPNSNSYITKEIPKSGQSIPVIGMGTSRTFNVGNTESLRKARTEVLRTFFSMGGQLIDSSPMYGSAEDVVGYGLSRLGKQNLVSATKVWTSSTSEGKEQFSDSLRLWRKQSIDIYQIHNLVNWREHLKVLRKYKEEGKIKYIGITTSHERRLDDFRTIMKSEPLDFVQFSYNLNERWNEKETLAIAKDRGIAVIINRPFERGGLFDKVEGKPLPEWAQEFDCANWAQFFLKWVVSHPAVTCAIPATTKVEHMKENMGAQIGKLPDSKMRDKMLAYYQGL